MWKVANTLTWMSLMQKISNPSIMNNGLRNVGIWNNRGFGLKKTFILSPGPEHICTFGGCLILFYEAQDFHFLGHRDLAFT